jgi:DNA invertase Pin-like site-specific DNA recombinase
VETIRQRKPKTASTRRAAIYLRISLDQTGEGLAIDRQKKDCEAIAQLKGWEVVRTYSDNSISASKKNVKRPGYDQMLEDLQAGDFDAVICYDLDRLTRQPRQLEDWIDLAQDRDIALVTANGEADLSNDNGRMFARIKATVARQEVERKGDRQARALRQRAERGGLPKGTRLTGYGVNGEVIEEEAKTVRLIFDRFAAGETLKGLSRELNEAGITTRQGKAWDSSTLHGILKNARYCGRSTYRELVRTPEGKKIYVRKDTGVKGNWQPLISESQFDLVQSRLNDPNRKTNRAGTERKHLGSGLFRCGVCGGKLRTSSNRYWCPVGGHVLRGRENVDSFVLKVITARLSQPDALQAFKRDDNELQKDIESRSKELLERLEVIENDYDDGIIDGLRYQAAAAKVNELLTALDVERARIVGGNALSSVLSGGNPADSFLSASLSVQRAIIDSLLSVTLLSWPRGKKGFDADSVLIEWRG